MTPKNKWLKEWNIQQGDRLIVIADPTEWRRDVAKLQEFSHVRVGQSGVYREVAHEGRTAKEAIEIVIDTTSRCLPFWCLIKDENQDDS